MRSTLSLVTLLIVLGGCASLNESQCRSGDWFEIGRKDGSEGKPRTRVGKHLEACAEYGITPDNDTYRKGWDDGIKTYCTPHNGFDRGMMGAAAGTACPASLSRDFLRGYQLGKNIRVQKQKLHAIEQSITNLENQVVASGTTPAQRRDFLSQLRVEQRKKTRLAGDLRVLEKQARAAGWVVR